MSARLRLKKQFLGILLNFAAWSALFAIAYSQSPLYTSNQNQYFLHAYARLGFGFLQKDWLANTLDPTPAFTDLAYLTMRLLRQPALFYGYYAALMGVYLFSLLGIALELRGGDRGFNPKAISSNYATPIWNWFEGEDSLASLIILTLLFLIHSAGWRFGISRVLGINWSYILEDGVADQRMLGPVFQPSVFGVFLALSVLLFLHRKPYLAVMTAVLAAIFHPTYILPAALLTLAYLWVTWLEEHNLKKGIWIGVTALLVVLPILLYVAIVFRSTSPAIAAQARQVLVEYRIPHHAVISQWLDATAWIKIALIAVGLTLTRKRRLFWILLIPSLLGVGLSLYQGITHDLSLALLFPWRVSTLLLPLAVTAMLTKMVDLAFPFVRRREKFCKTASLTLIALAVFVGGLRFVIDRERKINSPERGLYQYISLRKIPGEVYLIPVKMQDFRLETGAPIYVDFKSIPYKDNEIIEWQRRNQLANRFYRQPDCAKLPELIVQGVNNVVVPIDHSLRDCPKWLKVYADQAYILYAYVSR